MEIPFLSGRQEITLSVPPGADVYRSRFPEPAAATAAELVLDSLRNPFGAPPLREALAARLSSPKSGKRSGDVVIVVSDATRPVPYAQFLPELLGEIEAAGVRRDEIVVLIATGMHRPSTPDERREMFGPDVADGYRILDHDAENESELAGIPGVHACLNRRFVEAGFRVVTGLVEPHFMAGFSGGRKAVFPGLASLDSIRGFHGEAILSDPRVRNANLVGNPLHEEALGVAAAAGVDFSLNVILDRHRRLVRAFAGGLEPAHEAACDFVKKCACREVKRPCDVVLTSSGGHPLDATFYQCVKGFVSCLPAVKEGGTVIVFGGCSEGVGGPEYAELMERYSGRWKDFLEDIKRPGVFAKDQWQFQMHARALAKVGQEELHFVTDGLPAEVLRRLSVTGHAAEAGGVGKAVQEILDGALAGGRTLAVFPEGPYCVPIE